MRGIVCLLLACSTGTCAAQVAAKKTVAVLNFENAAIQTAAISNSSFATQPPDVGKGVSELLIARLVQDAIVIVVERAAIDKVMAEQNLSNSNRADPKTAAQLGKILGVDAIILGTITHYDYTEQIHKANGFFGASSSPKAKYDVSAKVQITARVVNPNTAEVLATSEGMGESERKNVKVDLRDQGSRLVMASGVNSPVMNDALEKAIAQLAAMMEPQLAAIPKVNH